MDLNLIRPLCVLLEELHVSRAAERCEMSQPAMSRILERLRSTFGDELLVRNGRNYGRTPRGDAILAEFREVLNRIESTVAGSQFLPEHYDMRFRVATTDYASAVFVPHLLRDLEERSPGSGLSMMAWNERSYDDLETGRLDAAIMSADDPPSSLVCEPLFEEDYVCMVSLDHPIRGNRVSLESYLACRHAVVDIMRGWQPSIDQPLVARGQPRRIGYVTPFAGSAVFAAAQTTLILTLPRRLAMSYRNVAPVRMLAAPAEIGGFSYSLLWHKRLDTSGPHGWFRSRIKRVASDLFDVERLRA